MTTNDKEALTVVSRGTRPGITVSKTSVCLRQGYQGKNFLGNELMSKLKPKEWLRVLETTKGRMADLLSMQHKQMMTKKAHNGIVLV